MADKATRSGGTLSDCSLKALDLLAIRQHFRRQLESKLEQRGFDREQIHQACDLLEERGFLDDAECARSLATGSFARKLYGPRRMKAELIRRGAPEHVAEQAVATAFEEGEERALRSAAERWIRRSRWDRQKLARHLERKGFSSGTILRVVREFEPSGDEQSNGHR